MCSPSRFRRPLSQKSNDFTSAGECSPLPGQHSKYMFARKKNHNMKTNNKTAAARTFRQENPAVPSAVRTVGLLETLDAYVMTAIVQQSTEEESAEGKAAEDIAIQAHGDLYAFLDGMLHAAFTNGQAFTAAELADSPQVALRNANKLLH